MRWRDRRRSDNLELQADCFAGIWSHFARRRNLLEPGEVESRLAAAAALGAALLDGVSVPF